MTDIGSLVVDGNSWVWDLNDIGQVVGSSETESSANDRAILWFDGQLTNLGALPCQEGGPSEARANPQKAAILPSCR